MGLEYYIFALFIAVLVCVVAIIFKVLFSDVKRQNKLLDERETQVLQLYSSVETLIEEFQDQLKAATDEFNLREQEYRAAMKNMEAFKLPPEFEKKEQAIERVPRSSAGIDAKKIKAAEEIISRAEHLIVPEPVAPPAPKPEPKQAVFRKFFDDAVEAPPPTPYAPAAINGGSRRDSILALADEGKSDVEIASQLGITRNEVQLVVGLTR